MTRPGIKPRSPGPLANTLTIRPMSDAVIRIINNTESILEKEMHKIFWDFEILTAPPNPNLNNQRTCPLVDFAVPTNHRVKIKESKRIDKYLDLARELKKFGT